MTYDNWKSTDLSDWDYQDQDGEQECQHEWCTLKDLFGEPYGVCMKCGYENDE